MPAVNLLLTILGSPTLAVFFNHNIPLDPAASRKPRTFNGTDQTGHCPGPLEGGRKSNQQFSRLTHCRAAPVAIQLQIAQLLADMQKSAKPPKAPGILVQSANRAVVFKALNKPWAAANIDGSLHDALKQLEISAGINIYVDWP